MKLKAKSMGSPHSSSPSIPNIDLTQGVPEQQQQGKQPPAVARSPSPEPVHQEEQPQGQGTVTPTTEDEHTDRSETPGLHGSSEGEQHEGGQRGKRKKVLSEEKIKRIKENYNRRGVVYVSRIPPHMKPMKLKELLSQYGDTLRVYCAPEDPKARKIRKRKGGNTGKNFTEGWVEFVDKRVAKRVALALNGQRIGGKRRSAYYDDLWCLKYLPHFKWDDLTEEIAYQRAVHEQKMAAEVSAAKKERDYYLQQVDRSKAIRAIAERRAAKQGKAGGESQEGAPSTSPAATSEPPGLLQGSTVKEGGKKKEGGRAPFSRNFMQRHAKADPTSDASAPQLADDVLMMVGNSRKKQKAGQ